MNATILCVGKLRETWQAEGVREYLKRLSRYGKYAVEQVEDVPDNLPRAMQKEGESLLKRIRPEDYVIALCIRAAAPDSPGLAEHMRRWAQTGRRVVLLIGGSNGLAPEVLARADEKISFSNLTFPHGLMRVILLEQIYRGEKILAGERYHK